MFNISSISAFSQIPWSQDKPYLIVMYYFSFWRSIDGFCLLIFSLGLLHWGWSLEFLCVCVFVYMCVLSSKCILNINFRILLHKNNWKALFFCVLQCLKRIDIILLKKGFLAFPWETRDRFLISIPVLEHRREFTL